MTLNFDTENLDEINNSILNGCVPEVSINENHLAERDEALLAHLETAKLVLNKLYNLLSKLLSHDADQQIRPEDILNSCLYLCGEHCKSNLPWSDIESYSLMNLCIEKICSLMNCHSINELFTKIDVSSIFVGLQYKLKNDNWKKYPAAVECYMWVLKYLKVIYLE
jgi:hypothetical protein|uniref:Uncharacterized protein n=1 Tax=Sipha flava TaxID=143950 RepID=A0A2S2R1W1_9HEMI